MKLHIEQIKGKVHMAVKDNDRVIASSAGDTAPEAARWLVRHVNRIVQQTEHLLIDARLLTEEEVDEVVLADND